MTKDTFKMFTDATTGLNYIKRVEDEETKNHKNYDEDITTAFMPEIKNSKMYPVQSYLTYLYLLSKDLPDLWQSPSNSNLILLIKIFYVVRICGKVTLIYPSRNLLHVAHLSV